MIRIIILCAARRSCRAIIDIFHAEDYYRLRFFDAMIFVFIVAEAAAALMRALRAAPTPPPFPRRCAPRHKTSTDVDGARGALRARHARIIDRRTRYACAIRARKDNAVFIMAALCCHATPCAREGVDIDDAGVRGARSSAAPPFQVIHTFFTRKRARYAAHAITRPRRRAQARAAAVREKCARARAA